MRITPRAIMAIVVLGTATGADAQPGPGHQPGQWRPEISVVSNRHGLALRSQPIAAREPDPEPGSAPLGSNAPGSESQNSEQGSRLGRALSDSIGPFGLATGAFLLADGRHHSGQSRGATRGVAATLLATLALKRAVNSKRPNGGPRSFPSGHASLAFAFATAASYNHADARLPLFGLATAIAASRVDVRAHRPRDVIAGAALGFGLTRYFMRRSARDGAPSSSARAGMSFSRSF